MDNSRRSFIKQLSGLFAGLTVAGKLRAKEAEKAARYVDTFQKKSLRPVQTVTKLPNGQQQVVDVSTIRFSGLYDYGTGYPISLTGYYHPVVSG